MARKSFAAITGDNRLPTSNKKKAGEDVPEPEPTLEDSPVEAPPSEEAPAEEAPTDNLTVETKTTETEIPEDATELDCKVYLTPDGDLSIVPTDPLIIEGIEEPVTQMDIEVHSEEPKDDAVDPTNLETAPLEEEAPVEEACMSEAEVAGLMTSLNDANVAVSMVKAGTEQNPSWIVLKNGSLFATIDLVSQNADKADYLPFFASSEFPVRVGEAARSIGWHEVLPRMKAKLITDKGLAVAQTSVDMKAIKAEVRRAFFNDAQIAYSAMKARLRENPLAVSLFEASVAAEIPSPEVFVAGVLADPDGKFVSALFEYTAEVNDMSDSVKKEFKNLVARTTVPVTADAPAFIPDKTFMAKLANNSLPLASSSTPSAVPTPSRFSGIL
jgi:hypothetical protein